MWFVYSTYSQFYIMYILHYVPFYSEPELGIKCSISTLWCPINQLPPRPALQATLSICIHDYLCLPCCCAAIKISLPVQTHSFHSNCHYYSFWTCFHPPNPMGICALWVSFRNRGIIYCICINIHNMRSPSIYPRALLYAVKRAGKVT